jgi:YesN/AraC family two-component response regulator
MGYISLIRAYVIELMLMIFRNLYKNSENSQQDNNFRKQTNKQAKTIDYILNYIYNHYDTNISLENLSNQVFLSKDIFPS